VAGAPLAAAAAATLYNAGLHPLTAQQLMPVIDVLPSTVTYVLYCYHNIFHIVNQTDKVYYIVHIVLEC